MSYEWEERAACRAPNVDPDWFIVDGHDAEQKALNLLARAVCKRCPVQVECDLEATRTNANGQIWAGRSRRGQTPQQPVKPRRNNAPPVPCGYCGTQFQPLNAIHRFCTKTCAEADLKARGGRPSGIIPRPPACGTPRAVARHRRNGEPCEVCQVREDGTRTITRELKPCGTPGGYRRHYNRKEPICDPCREAYNADSAARIARHRQERAKRRSGAGEERAA